MVVLIVIKNNYNKLRLVRVFSVDDDTPFREVDLMNDPEFENVRIVSFGYNSSTVDYNSFIKESDVDDDSMFD